MNIIIKVHGSDYRGDHSTDIEVMEIIDPSQTIKEIMDKYMKPDEYNKFPRIEIPCQSPYYYKRKDK